MQALPIRNSGVRGGEGVGGGRGVGDEEEEVPLYGLPPPPPWLHLTEYAQFDPGGSPGITPGHRS